MAVGCGAPKRVDQSLAGLEKNTSQLRSENQDLRRRIEDLSNEVLVLQDRLETLKIHVEQRPEALPRPMKTAKSRIKNQAVVSSEAPKKEEAPQETGEEPFLIRNDPRDQRLPTIQLSNRDLERVEKRRAAAAAAPVVAKAPSPEVAEPAAQPKDNPEATKAYNEAFKKFEDGNFNEAIVALEKFVGRFHDHPYADNAVFWIGESFFKMGDFERAVREFERVGKEFPGGNKVPDAMLRMGDCYVRLAKPDEARKAYEKIVSAYPQSIAAEKARAWISEYSATAEKGRI